MTQSRTGSVYMAVVVVIAAVTVLTLTGVELRKRINDRGAVAADASAAHVAARSGAELVIQRALADRDGFHTLATTGTVFSGVSVRPGTVSAQVRDAATDGVVAADTRRYAVVTDAAAGQARSRLGFELLRPEDPFTVLIRAEASAVAYWPLDEDGASTAVEKLSGRNGVYNVPHAAGDETHAHGNLAPRINSSAEYIRVPHQASYELSNGTLCFWVRFDNKPNGGQRVSAVTKDRNPLNSKISLGTWLDRNNFNFMLQNSYGFGRTVSFSSSKIIQGQWHHIAVTWGSAGMELYLDGTREVRETGSGYTLGLGLGLGFTNDFDWFFGVRNLPQDVSGFTDPTRGSLARVAVFSERLSGSKIRELYEASSVEPGFRVVPGSFARVVD